MSNTLSFLHVPVDLQALYRMSDDRDWAAGRSFDEGRALHHVLAETFGKGVLQPFRLLVPPRKKKGALYAYSRQSPDELIETRQLCLPDMPAVLDLDALAIKTVGIDFQPDRRLGFDIRICPVRRTDKNGDRNKSREIDAFLHEALQHEDDKDWMADNNRTREAVYTDWLAERLAGAATLEQATLARFRRTIKSRGKGKQNKASQSPDAVLQGTLIVTDSTAFAEKLSQGISRHKSYGFGMILLRPPHMPPLKQ